VKTKPFGTGYLQFLVGLTVLMVTALALGSYAAWYRASNTAGYAVIPLLSTSGDRAISSFNDLHLYPFDSSRMTMAVLKNSARGRWIRVETHDAVHSALLGVALVRDMPVDGSAALEMDWCLYDSPDQIELTLIEKVPATGKRMYYTRPAGSINDGWVLSRFPVKSFSYNAFENPPGFSGRKMNPGQLVQLDIGIFPGPITTMDIRGIRMLWDPGKRWFIGALASMLAVLGLLIPGTFRMRLFDTDNPKGILGAGITGRMTLSLTILALALLHLQGLHPGTLVSNLILAGGTILVSLPGAVTFIPPIRHRLWGIRNFAVWAAAIGAGFHLGLWQAVFATIIIILPALESRDRRLIYLNAIGVLAGIFATLPFELAGNRIIPALVFAALLLLGVILVERILFPAAFRSSASTLKLYEGLFHHVPDGIFTCTDSYRLLTVNPGFENLTGLRRAEIEGRDFRDFILQEDHGVLEAPWVPEEESRTLELRFKTGGAVRHTLTRIQRLIDRGVPYGFQAIATDITRQKALEEQLRAMNESLYGMSMQDSLTGIANRRMFDEHLEKEWQRAYRHSSRIALVFMDIDHFKTYNDTYGHPAGDRCLCRIAEELSRFGRRSGELLARHGGEEFALILPQISAPELEQLCQQLILSIDELGIPHDASPVSTRVSISVGCAWRSGFYDSMTALIAEADEALYEAKHCGRRQAVVRAPKCGLEDSAAPSE